jgi:hypothetical protein
VAATAKTTADTAASTAATAKTTADAAASTASTANTTANTAKTTADTAKTTADAAKTTATTAASAAAAAQATASKAWNQVDSYTRAADDITDFAVSGIAPVVATETTGLKGKVWRKTGTGNGVWIDRRGLIQIKPDNLYRVSVTVRVTQDSTTSGGTAPGGRNLYAGVACYIANGTTLVNVNGAASSGSQHYVTASSRPLTVADGWVTVQGYIAGWDAPGTGSARPDPDNPGRCYSTAVYMAPMVYLDYNGGNGVWEVSHWSIDSIPIATQWALAAQRDALAVTTATLSTKIDQSTTAIQLAASQKYQTLGAAAAFQEEMATRFQLTATEVQMVFTRAAQLVAGVDGDLRQEVTARESMIRYADAGISMGVSNSPFEMRLDNDSLDFLANGVIQAMFGVDRMYIKTAEILQALVLGPWSVSVDANQNLNFRRA